MDGTHTNIIQDNNNNNVDDGINNNNRNGILANYRCACIMATISRVQSRQKQLLHAMYLFINLNFIHIIRIEKRKRYNFCDDCMSPQIATEIDHNNKYVAISDNPFIHTYIFLILFHLFAEFQSDCMVVCMNRVLENAMPVGVMRQRHDTRYVSLLYIVYIVTPQNCF